MFHKEGAKIILISTSLTVVIFLLSHKFIDVLLLEKTVQLVTLFFLIMILQFFRNPKRTVAINENHIIAPVDGKVVVIEEVFEPEYFKDKRLQVSIFMSPINVHVTRYAMSGKINFSKYHPGKYLVAWHPKASTENERTTVVMEHENGKSILMRQIAGALARRIVYYCKEGEHLQQGEEFGFIKFGSRVDVFVPVGTKIDVQLNQVVKEEITTLASFSYTLFVK